MPLSRAEGAYRDALELWVAGQQRQRVYVEALVALLRTEPHFGATAACIDAVLRRHDDEYLVRWIDEIAPQWLRVAAAYDTK